MDFHLGSWFVQCRTWGDGCRVEQSFNTANTTSSPTTVPLISDLPNDTAGGTGERQESSNSAGLASNSH